MNEIVVVLTAFTDVAIYKLKHTIILVVYLANFFSDDLIQM